MTSKQLIPVAGHPLTVYGLEEYKALKVKKPVAIMFALHGRLQNMSKMEDICQALCSLNNNNTERHLIVITFDHPNHGGRLVHKPSNQDWGKNGQGNPFHAQDMWNMYNESSNTVSLLIDVVEDYLFGPTQQSRVQVWGVMGFSMGGHSTFVAAANDPRITVAIPIVGTADFLGLLTARLNASSLPENEYLPQKFQQVVKQKMSNLDHRLKNTKLLMISGEKDTLVPGFYNNNLVKKLELTHSGKKGQDWDFIIVPDCGHEWKPLMFDLSRQWCQKWMLGTSTRQAHL